MNDVQLAQATVTRKFNAQDTSRLTPKLPELAL